MADYNWYKFENTQDNANLINNAVCERWQAGIELAGGSWSGSFEDGKDSITIDEFNALESQIAAKVSSYTPRNYDPNSTSQIVPGVDGWNRIEDGILKAICTPTGVNRNYLLATRESPLSSTGKTNFGSRFTRTEDEDGFGVVTINLNGSAATGVFYTSILADNDQWANKQAVFSFDCLTSGMADNLSEYRLRLQIVGTNNFTSFTNKAYVLSQFNASNITILNPDDIKDDEWFRLNLLLTVPAMSGYTQQIETEYADYLYVFGIQTAQSTRDVDWSIKKAKLEIASEGTEWVPAMEDYGYGDNVATTSASPQSVEDGSDSEVAPGPVEIE